MQHLQLLGVKYFIAETPQVEQEAAADPGLQLVAKTGPWTYDYSGVNSRTTWDVYLVKHSPLVTPLVNDPVVLSGVKPGPASWLGSAAHEGPALSWYGDPSKWNVELAQSGPSDWPRTPVSDIRPTVKHVGTTGSRGDADGFVRRFPRVAGGDARAGEGVLLPQLARHGADGPWRVTPNLMVVVPTSHDVVLTYGASGANVLGLLATLIGLVRLRLLFTVPAVRRRLAELTKAGNTPVSVARALSAASCSTCRRMPRRDIRRRTWPTRSGRAGTVHRRTSHPRRDRKNRKCLICLA